MNVNVVALVGNLTRDAEQFADGKVTKFGLAVNEREKQGDEWVDRASFFDVTCFGKTGDAVMQYLSKGSKAAVSGRLRQDRWTTDGGDNRSKVVVVADRVQFLDSKPDSNGRGSDVPADGDGITAEDARQAAAAAKGDDDIPFARPRIPDHSTRRRDVFAGDRWMA